MQFFSLQHLLIVSVVFMFALSGVEPVMLIVLYGVMLTVAEVRLIAQDVRQIREIIAGSEDDLR